MPILATRSIPAPWKPHYSSPGWIESCLLLHRLTHAHTLSLSLRDNDRKQEGHLQTLVSPQVLHPSVITHFDAGVFAKACLQWRRECLTLERSLPRALEELFLVWCHRKGLLYVPVLFVFLPESAAELPANISLICVFGQKLNKQEAGKSRAGDEL